MRDQPADDQKQHSASFLLEEYRHLTESFLRNEELGERRVSFFITLTTAVIGASVAFQEVLGGTVDPSLFLLGLLAILLFGIATLVRMIHRNLKTHEYLRALGRIRRFFADRDPGIIAHLPYLPYDDRPQRKKEWSIRSICSFGTGGLVEMVELMNSLIIAALLVVSTHDYRWWVFLPLGLIGFAAAWIGQYRYVMYRYEKGKPKKEEIRFPKQSRGV